MDAWVTGDVDQHIVSRMQDLRLMLHDVRGQHRSSMFRRHYRARRYTHLVGAIQQYMGLAQLRVVVGYVTKAPAHVQGVAWVRTVDLERLRTGTYTADTPVIIHIRRSFLERVPCAVVVACIAHEFAHLLLAQKGSLLCYDEKSVDLCAIMMGFEQEFQIAQSYVERSEIGWFSKVWHRIRTGKAPYVVEKAAGYLSESEMLSARMFLAQTRCL